MSQKITNSDLLRAIGDYLKLQGSSLFAQEMDTDPVRAVIDIGAFKSPPEIFCAIGGRGIEGGGTNVLEYQLTGENLLESGEWGQVFAGQINISIGGTVLADHRLEATWFLSDGPYDGDQYRIPISGFPRLDGLPTIASRPTYEIPLGAGPLVGAGFQTWVNQGAPIAGNRKLTTIETSDGGTQEVYNGLPFNLCIRLGYLNATTLAYESFPADSSFNYRVVGIKHTAIRRFMDI